MSRHPGTRNSHLFGLRSLEGEPNGTAEHEPIRVLVCEDHEVYRLGLRMLVETEPDLVLVGEVQDVPQASALADQVGCDVVIVRQGLLESPGYEPLRELCRRGFAVLVLAESASELELVRALRAGPAAICPVGSGRRGCATPSAPSPGMSLPSNRLWRDTWSATSRMDQATSSVADSAERRWSN